VWRERGAGREIEQDWAIARLWLFAAAPPAPERTPASDNARAVTWTLAVRLRAATAQAWRAFSAHGCGRVGDDEDPSDLPVQLLPANSWAQR
jgi:hypothetical protein